jgi:hypothetical protein
MATDPATITSFTCDGLVHRPTKVSDSDPVLTNEGWFRTTLKCGLTCDCAPSDLDDRLRFGVDPSPTITCMGCV